jgi:hypothetical protein
MTNTTEILQAKAEAVRALADALSKAVQTGQVGGPSGAVAFAENWADAVESMLPTVAPSEPWGLEATTEMMERLAEGQTARARQEQAEDAMRFKPCPY